MYTVLPPPQGYNVHAEKSVTLFQLESVNREEDPTGKTAIVLTFMDIAMHHLVHRDLWYGLSLGLLSQELKSFILIVFIAPMQENTGSTSKN